jgi:hypothetical protein
MLHKARVTHHMDEFEMEEEAAGAWGVSAADIPELPGDAEGREAWLMYELELPFVPYTGLVLLKERFSVTIGDVVYDLQEQVFQCEVESLTPAKNVGCAEYRKTSPFDHDLELLELLGWYVVEVSGLEKSLPRVPIQKRQR